MSVGVSVSMEKATELYNFLFHELADPRSSQFLLMDRPFTMIAVLGVYIYSVTVLGPQWMKNKEPFKLERLMIFYNIFQILINGFIFVEAYRVGWGLGGKYSWLCEPLDRSETPEAVYIVKVVHYYFLVKLIDLLDTVFMVLRKRLNHITFLHVYHHAGMCALAWGGAKYLPGGHSTFLGFVNTFVHAVMYTYYLVSTLKPSYKRDIWWKKYLTQLQMIQFFLVAAHSCILIFQPSCTYPKFVVFIVVPQNIFMFVLFLDFYRKAYLKIQQKLEEQDLELQEHSISNGHTALHEKTH